MKEKKYNAMPDMILAILQTDRAFPILFVRFSIDVKSLAS